MFTGIIQEKGIVKEISEAGEGLRISVARPESFQKVSNGESISVSGACLTVESFDSEALEFFLAEETLEKTWFNQIKQDDTVNLERSLKAGDRLSGHIVQGHIETTSEVQEIEELEEGWNIKFSLPENIQDLVVHKGYVAVEGISLTITEVTNDSFSVTVIPETWKRTNLSEKKEGDKVNLETDMMGKYAKKIIK